MNPQPKALFDVSVLVDALTNDGQPTPESNAALTLAANGDVAGYVCATAIEYLNDFLTRSQGSPRARAKLTELRAMLEVAPVDAAVVDAAMDLGWLYFEDALTHACARVNGLDHVITLNPSDFPETTLPVLAPADFLRRMQAKVA
ncbi:type II toxin-antitoxin system VapC family toxin [Thiocystis violacea]|uniref:type II toxin-antitoxin system VapC family toxin n=1 Tax=Thiocystis violacea TaxID=13725 RepID=UPI0019054EBF|nr:PIN domain-containing protein [Thiocystis violacea]MBK1717147.1 twitching motility protein PilT [Thiocystis violacea]